MGQGNTGRPLTQLERESYRASNGQWPPPADRSQEKNPSPPEESKEEGWFGLVIVVLAVLFLPVVLVVGFVVGIALLIYGIGATLIGYTDEDGRVKGP